MILDASNGPWSVLLNDDGAVAYAYLLRDDEIVSDVWLYNAGETPTTPPWNEPGARPPFPNPVEFVATTTIAPLTADLEWTVDWRAIDEGGPARLIIDNELVAELLPHSTPGSSITIATAGPLGSPLISDPLAPCRCRLCIPDNTANWGPLDHDVAHHVQASGYMLLSVGPSNELPGWSYTIGLTHTFGIPELIMFSLAPNARVSILHDIVKAIRNGVELSDTLPPGIGSKEHPDALRPVHPAWSWTYGLEAAWFNRRKNQPLQQVIWCDDQGRFPWDPRLDQLYRDAQPNAWDAPASHPDNNWLRGLRAE